MHRLIILLTAALCVSCGVTKETAVPSGPDARAIVVAHRGAWKSNALPENSIAALKHAFALQCAGSEFDVRMTADDSLIINHDPKYHALPIEQSTYAELASFTLSNGEKLPTLREYMLAGLDPRSATKLVCEIKPSETSSERGQVIAVKVVRLVKELAAQDKYVYISFDYEILKKIVELDPHAHTQYLDGSRSPAQLKADGIAGADYHISTFKDHPEWIDSAKRLNIRLNAWTVNKASDMDWLLARGFDYITTNEPELLRERVAEFPKATTKKNTQ